MKKITCLLLLLAAMAGNICAQESWHAVGIGGNLVWNNKTAAVGTHLKYQWTINDLLRIEPSVGFNFTHSTDIPDGECAGLAVHFLGAKTTAKWCPYFILGANVGRYCFGYVMDMPGWVSSSDPQMGSGPVHEETFDYTTSWTGKAGLGVEWRFMNHLSLQLEAKGNYGTTNKPEILNNKYVTSKYIIKHISFFDASLSLMYRF